MKTKLWSGGGAGASRCLRAVLIGVLLPRALALGFTRVVLSGIVLTGCAEEAVLEPSSAPGRLFPRCLLTH
ncbi:MAG: hypothetical protein ACOX8V_07340 [Thermoleophilia bacterium]|jgi:hypothetical protein